MTKARSGIDIGRLGKAVQRPGIDPRIWLTLGTVKEVGFDAAHGIFADVVIQPDGNVETCYVATPYAGALGGKIGFGDWCPVEVDDTVLVAYPRGDSNEGPIIIARFWNSGDLPPTQIDGPDSGRWLIIKPMEKYTILATLAGLLDAGGTQVEVDPSGFTIKTQLSAAAFSAEMSVAPEEVSISQQDILGLTGFKFTGGPAGVKLHTNAPLVAGPVSLGDDSAMPLAHAAETLAQTAGASAGITAIVTALTTIQAAFNAIAAVPLTGTSAGAAMAPALATLATAMIAMASTMGAAAATLPTLKVKGT